MARDTWFKCDPIDFLDGLERLESSDQVTTYLAVILRIYATQGPIPNNPAGLVGPTHLSRVKIERAIASLVDQGRLVLVDGGLMNPRAADELAARGALSEKRSAAGKTGGRPPKVEQKLEQTQAKPGQNSEQTEIVFGAEGAENRHSDKANAFHARARGEEREENPPNPPSPRVGLDGLPMPDFDAPPTPEETAGADARLARRLDDIDRNADLDRPSSRDLISEIMKAARMVGAPMDMNLVSGWLAIGMDPDKIMTTVHRMVASARQPVRGFRYFDQTLREQHEQDQHASSSFIREMQAIERRNRRE